MAEPIVRVDFSMPAAGGGTYQDSLQFTIAEWQGFTAAKRQAIQNGTHQLCMDRYNAWNRAREQAQQPVVLTTRQQRRIARRERIRVAAEALAALQQLELEDPDDNPDAPQV